MGVILTHRGVFFIYSSPYNYDGGEWEDLRLSGLLLSLVYLQKRKTEGLKQLC